MTGTQTPAASEHLPVRHGVDLLVEGLWGLGTDRSLPAIMRLTTHAAAVSLPGANDASITVRAGHRFATKAPTSDLPCAVDALQYAHGGPCLDAVQGTEPVLRIENLRTECRWPAFSAAALVHTPVLSMLSYRLQIGAEDPIGALNVFGTTPQAFDAETVTAGKHLAAYAAAVLAYAAKHQKVHNLEIALDSNRDIGAAIGILMTRRLVTRDQAFDLLRTTSQHANRKLSEIAEDVIRTGDLTA